MGCVLYHCHIVSVSIVVTVLILHWILFVQLFLLVSTPLLMCACICDQVLLSDDLLTAWYVILL